jgi:hypothetical protein
VGVMAAVGVTGAVKAATEEVREEAGSSAVNKTRRHSNCPHDEKKRNSPRSIPLRTTEAATARIRSAVDGLVAAAA